jgi:hypothetical protein
MPFSFYFVRELYDTILEFVVFYRRFLWPKVLRFEEANQTLNRETDDCCFLVFETRKT